MRISINLIRPRVHTQRKLFGAIASLMVLSFGATFAGEIIQSATMADVMFFMNKHRQLPEYAQVKMTEAELYQKFRDRKLPAQFAKIRNEWARIIGKSHNWQHFHHYCFGLIKFDKALRMTGGSKEAEMRRKAALNEALGEFQYIEASSTDSSFPLWSQLYIYEFQIYIRLGQPAMAQKAMQMAIKYRKKD